MEKKVILLIILLLVGTAKAGSISMTVSTEPVFFPDNISISLKNSGDESALNVRLSLLSDIFIADEIFISSLDAGQEKNFFLAINKAGEILPGLYPVVILTRYEDANGYPFSTVSPNSIAYKEGSSSNIFGVIKKTELSKDSEIGIAIRNMGNENLNLKLRLFLPLEITAEEYSKDVSIDAKTEKDVSFKISNFGALVGSSYFVVAALEYEDDKHYSSFASGIVSIVEEKGIFDQDLLIIMLFILIVIFIAYQMKGRFIK